MGKARWFSAVVVLILFVQRAAIGQQPLHWESTIDSGKAVARHSNRLVLVLFAAPWCTPCHHLENDIRNQPGAATALEANFVPVKIN
ncbi:MAG: thioredoxin family protein, partial [Thermoguttaceae bacterium]